jgi:hypothetical protein
VSLRSLQPGGIAKAGLRVQPHRCIGRAISIIITTLNHFEEHALGDGAAVKLEIFPLVIAIIEDVVSGQPLDQCGIERKAGFDVLIIVRSDVECRQSGGTGGVCGCEDIIRVPPSNR